jgi:hypothetical protein
MKTPWRSWYDFCNRNWWQLDLLQNCLLIAAIGVIVYLIVRLQKYGIPLLALAVLTGCTQSQTREQTETQKIDKVTVTGTVPMAGPEGIIQVPVSFTIDRTGTEQKEKQSETKTGIDGEALGRSIAASLGPVISAAVASTGVPWAQILSGGATAVVAATTGYLAIAKRGQMRRDPKP